MISTRNPIYYLYLGLICLALVLNACQPIVRGPTKPSGYRLTVPSTLQTTRLQSLTLTVKVTDTSGMPVSDVPVSFRLARPQTAVVDLDPQTVHAQRGQATTTVRAKTAGYALVEITVEDISETVLITIVGDTPRF